jgi:hypothetical protein
MRDQQEFEVQVSDCGSTIWVHSPDGSTVARFSRRFGVDLHTTVTEQLNGASECLFCTHSAPTKSDWDVFRGKLMDAYGVSLAPDLMEF